MATIAIESPLKINPYGLPTPKTTTTFEKLVNKAQSKNCVSDILADRLQCLRGTARNYMVHPRTMFGIDPLRTRKTGPHTWGEPGGPTMKALKEAAEEAIEFFWN